MLSNSRLISLASLSMLAVLSTSAQAEWFKNGPDSPMSNGAEGEDWKVSLGAGIVYAPKYQGSDNFKVKPIPELSADYKNGLFFVGGKDGIGSYFLQGDNYKVGASVGFAMGRDEDDDSENLRGMGDIDTAATINLLGEYKFGPVKLNGKISKGSEEYGTTAKIGLGTFFPVNEKLKMMTSLDMIWVDDKHMNTYFGVSSLQSARSGYRRYDAESGIKSVGINVGAIYSISERWDAKLMLKADQLLGDAADSPITKKDFVPMLMFSTVYKF